MIRFFFAFTLVISWALNQTTFSQEPQQKQLDAVRHVNDSTGLVPEKQSAAIETRLSAFEKETSIEVCILVVPNLGVANIDDYASVMFADWKIGRMKGADNGVLLVISEKQRLASIKIGKDLHPERNKPVTDALKLAVMGKLRSATMPEAIDFASKHLCRDWSIPQPAQAGGAASVEFFGGSAPANRAPFLDKATVLVLIAGGCLIGGVALYYSCTKKVTPDMVSVRIVKSESVKPHRSFSDISSEQARIEDERRLYEQRPDEEAI